MRFDAFTGPSYLTQSPIVDLQRTVNWYPELIESRSGKNARYALYPTPGVRLFATLPFGPIRGLHVVNGRLFAVGGPRLYEITDSATVTERSDSGMALDVNPASMTSNGDSGNQLMVSSGGRGYLLNLTTNAFSQPVTVEMTMLGFLNGYFAALDAVTSTLRVSALEDGTSWNASEISQRNTAADRWIGMRITNRLIYLWGNETSEVWYDAGISPFPFAFVQESSTPFGIISSFAHCDGPSGPVWITGTKAGRGQVYMAEGYSPRRISDHAIENMIQGYGTVSDVRAYDYQDQGHHFSLFSFPAANATLVYDHATQSWHERGFWDQPVMAYRASRQLFHAYAFNRHFVGDRLGSGIYEMAIDEYRDINNMEIRRLRRSPHLNDEDRMLSVSRFMLELEPAVGATTGLGANPQVMLRYSSNNGRTWSNEHMVSAGQVGQYRTRAQWRRLGRGRDFVFEIIVSDPVAWRIATAYLNIS